MSITHALDRSRSPRAFWPGFAGYLVPTFIIGYVWHLIAFAAAYHDLAIYRPDVILPLGLASIVIQATAFSWLYPRLFADLAAWPRNGLRYGLGLALVSWSFTTLAVGAKNVMASVPTYIALETGFTLVQFAIVGPLIALAYRTSGKTRRPVASA